MAKIKVRYVKFSPEEMAYEAPAEIDFSKGMTFRGVAEWEKYLSFKRGYAKLSPDIRKAFRSDRAVNAALRKVLRLRSAERTTKANAAK
jgi:hypothetical protein